MSYQVGSTCYSTPEAAVTAITAKQLGTVITHGGAAYLVTAAAPSGAAAVSYTLVPFAGGQSLTLAQPLELQPCAELTGMDALLYAGPVATAWLVTAAISGMRRALNDS